MGILEKIIIMIYKLTQTLISKQSTHRVWVFKAKRNHIGLLWFLLVVKTGP